MDGVALKFSAGKPIDFVLPGFIPNPAKQAVKLGYRLGLKFTSKKDLIRKLRKVPFPEILRNTPPTLVVPRASIPFDFGPVKESEWSKEPKFLDKSPEEIYRSGAFKELPLMTGSNSVRMSVC
jgi:Carboxylesterase family